MFLNTIARIRSLKPIRFFAVTMLFSSLAFEQAFGQIDMSPVMRGFSSTGTSTETIKPKSLRLVMQVSAKAKDAKKAIEELAAKKASLKKAFEEMKANVATLQFSDSKLTEQIAGSSGDEDTSVQAQVMIQMQRQMQLQMGSSGGAADAAVDMESLPTAFTCECQLKVDWDLPEGVESDVITLLKNRLEGEIKKRDLMKAGGSVDLSEEEKETLELFQSQTQGGGYSYGRSNQEFGSKIFVVGVVSEQLNEKLSKQAFEKAVARAKKISEATGIKKGEIVGVSFSSNQTDLMEPYRYMSRNFMYEDQTPDTEFFAPGEDEVIGTKLSDLKKSVSVVVIHEIVK
ncbi:MAG: SIMPL domain-containing protein [Pirellula sp.]|jgi:uncharacterized protein YggE|nr:SIMPL domain-containing protein [Pirellula sp.]